MSNISFQGDEHFSRGGFAPLAPPLVTGLSQTYLSWWHLFRASLFRIIHDSMIITWRSSSKSSGHATEWDPAGVPQIRPRTC